jgi:uncharacterized membrane protein (UPF0127 family)
MKRGYKAVNATQNNIIAPCVDIADTPWDRFWGLMNKPGVPEGYGLWIVPCSDIHSLFMRFEFDAVFVDKQGKVVKLVENMKPWGLSLAKGAHAVLELDGGVIAKSGIRLYDTIALETI